ncbi:MAG: YajQ family cyclic di-GMP-binding protein, partial [Woeseiaceae bacterium]
EVWRVLPFGCNVCDLCTDRNLSMPSFDVVSDFDAHEARNGVDQANREVTTRFDFKGTGSKYELEEQVISLTTQSDFQLKQMIDILHQKLSKRGIDISCLEEQEVEFAGSEARQKIILRRGIDADRARKLVKQIKAAKLKVQTAIQGDKLRVSGKKRDDLQAVISLLKETEIGLPLQYENFRD